MSEESSDSRDLVSRILPTQRFWHQGPVRRDVVSVPNSPQYGARFHVAAGPAAWYASSTQQGAWAELFRHFLDAGVDPFEVRRRVARVRVESLRVLDLTSDATRRSVGVSLDELHGDDYAACQRVAQLARERGFDGILAPSAALANNTTLVVFDTTLAKITVELSGVTVPPPRLADLLTRIRLHRDVPGAVRDLVHYLEALGGEAIRRRRR